jgi:hypothetical protein
MRSTWPRSPRSATGTAKDAPCYDKKLAEGKTHKEALRALKRRISDAIYAALVADARRTAATGPKSPGGHERALHPAGQVLTAKQAPLVTRLLLDLEDAEGVRSWVDDPGGPGGCTGCWPGSAALVLQLSPAFPAESLVSAGLSSSRAGRRSRRW